MVLCLYEYNAKLERRKIYIKIHQKIVLITQLLPPQRPDILLQVEDKEPRSISKHSRPTHIFKLSDTEFQENVAILAVVNDLYNDRNKLVSTVIKQFFFSSSFFPYYHRDIIT